MSKLISFTKQALLLALPIVATCLYPLITLAAANRFEIPLNLMLMPAAIAIGIALAIGSALACIPRHGAARFASILLSAFILFTFAFRDLVVGPAVLLAYFIENAHAETVGTYLWFGLGTAGIVAALLMRRIIQRAFGALTTIAIALMLIPLFTTPWRDSFKTANYAAYLQNITSGNKDDIPVHTGPSEYTRQADGRRVRAPPRARVEGMPRTLVPTTQQPHAAHYALALHRSAPHESLCHPLVHGHRLTLLHSPPHGLDGLWHRWLRSGRAAQRDCTNGTHGRISTWKISTS